MKTMPKVGDRVALMWFDNIQKGTIQSHVEGNPHRVNMLWDSGEVWCGDWTYLRRLVKKPRKCEECAKPKQLFYVGHDGDIVTQTQIERRLRKHKTDILTMWEYISTLALISTEEVKK